MIVDRKMRWRAYLRFARPQLSVMFVYAAVITGLDVEGFRVSVPIAVPALLGTAISIALGFRTNSAYDRWWEARKIWGAIVNDSRTFTRHVLTLLGGADDASAAVCREMVYRQIAWVKALARSLRGQDPLEGLGPLLAQDEMARLRDVDNCANAILHNQAAQLRRAHDAGMVSEILMLPITESIQRLTDSMGMCERIKKTVFPVQYSQLVMKSVWLFYLLLPLGLAPYLDWLTLPVAFTVGFVFVALEYLGHYLEDPFEDRPSDVSITSIAATIEIDLRQMLGESEVPPRPEPVDGILM